MPHKRLIWFAMVVAALVVAGCLVLGEQRQIQEDDADLDPSVCVLLDEPVDAEQQARFLPLWDHRGRFSAALAALASQHGLPPEEYRAHLRITEGAAFRVGRGPDGRVVVVLRDHSGFIPGPDTQHLLLLDRHGRLLDRLSCEVSTRLTTDCFGCGCGFRTDVPEDPEGDGAQFVIRLVPKRGPVPGDGSEYQLTHAGKTETYRWGEDRAGATPSADGSQEGLCRVAIRDGKFHILFPKPDPGQVGFDPP
jgi:hypothetical protein